MNSRPSDFTPGLYLIQLPRKVRNVSTIVSIVFVRNGPVNCVTIHTARKRRPNLELLKKKGWVFLENDSAGPEERSFVSLVTRGGLKTGCEYFEDFGLFSDREKFFSFLLFTIQCREEMSQIVSLTDAFQGRHCRH